MPYSPADHRDKNDKTEKNYGLKSRNKVNDPRGNHEGGPGSWRDFKDIPENSFPKFQKRKIDETAEFFKQKGSGGNVNLPQPEHPLGKNLPTIWLIGSEPHNFQKELGPFGYKVKDDLTKEQQNYLIKELDRLKIL